VEGDNNVNHTATSIFAGIATISITGKATATAADAAPSFKGFVMDKSDYANNDDFGPKTSTLLSSTSTICFYEETIRPSTIYEFDGKTANEQRRST